ncbi:TetR family transcriptional regulator [[Mycobacterium] wendilense]|uniref:TetR family transcriptional regulator n=1 Tax=[Mycobacterium] wendilense TaxID=3064284 RepID=A0ABM9MIN8_9MYCO|nr:TetR family transcriptional regulator [Mycolicibacterium sp. MU0050]CAJ1585967.1 TetR family transcriptional regulator [Mycolicibacterium sp. MU0050]
MAAPAEKPRRRGRRQGASVSREQVLPAAKRRFAEQGYTATTLRQIAADVGVDAAMVLYLFGSKAELFRESMRLILDPQRLVAVIAEAPRAELGVRVARTYFEIWEDPESGPSLAAMLASATSNDDAHQAFREFMRDYVLTAAAGALGGGPDTRLRAMLAATNLVGTAMLRYVMAIGPLAEVSLAEAADMIGPSVQRYLTGDLDELNIPARFRG